MSRRLIDLATQGDVLALSLLVREALRQGLSGYANSQSFFLLEGEGSGKGNEYGTGEGDGPDIGDDYGNTYGGGYGDGENCGAGDHGSGWGCGDGFGNGNGVVDYDDRKYIS